MLMGFNLKIIQKSGVIIMNMKSAHSFVVLSLMLLFVGSAQAGLITSNPGTGVTTTFTQTGSTNASGPVMLDGFTITGDPQFSYGDSLYGIGGSAGNGRWTDFSWIGTGNGLSTFTIDLGGLYGLVGGFMNYMPNSGGNNATIEALAADMSLLESYDLTALAPISTPGADNDGAFRGIDRAEEDIAFLRLGGDLILIHDLTLGDSQAQVSAPGTLALFGLGLFGFAWLRRRV